MSIIFFTIITSTYNTATTIPILLKSLTAQTCQDFELIIQDGASCDNTIAIIESYRNKLPALSLSSEPDKGIYDAWNEALSRINGKWVIFLGADDVLAANDILEKCKYILANLADKIAFAGGGVDIISKNGEIVNHIAYSMAKWDANFDKCMPFPHQGLFHRGTLFAKNRFDSSLKITADYDFICRTWTKENGNVTLPFTITKMARGGISDSPKNVLRLRLENALVASRYFSHTWTAPCILSLINGFIIWIMCNIIGSKNSAKLLDKIRAWRGLPPSWSGL